MSNFSFSPSIFKRLVLQTLKNNGLFGKGLIPVIILGCAIGANLLPMAHENMTYGPQWPLKILDGANLYPNCTEKNKIDTSNALLQETFRDKYLYLDGFVQTKHKNKYLSKHQCDVLDYR